MIRLTRLPVRISASATLRAFPLVPSPRLHPNSLLRPSLALFQTDGGSRYHSGNNATEKEKSRARKAIQKALNNGRESAGEPAGNAKRERDASVRRGSRRKESSAQLRHPPAHPHGRLTLEGAGEKKWKGNLARRPLKPLQDEEHIRTRHPYPTQEEYPNVPASIFDLDSLSNLASKAFPNALEISNLTSRQLGDRPGFKFTLNASDGGRNKFKAYGEGLDKAAAKRAAFANLLSQLHSSGWLKETYSKPLPEALNLNDKEIRTELDAKADVYNYCARFRLLPRFESGKMAPEKLKAIRNPLRRRAAARFIETTISLPEQNITVHGLGKNSLSADIAASLAFKREVEKRLQSQDQEQLDIVTPYALSSETADLFFDFYKRKYRHAQIDLKSSPVKGSKVEAQLVLNDAPLGEPVIMHTKKQAESLAYLTGALALVQQDEKLGAEFERMLQRGKGSLPPPPRELDVDAETIETMQRALNEAYASGLKSLSRFDDINNDTNSEFDPKPRPFSEARAKRRSQRLQEMAQEYQNKESLQNLRKLRSELPVSKYRDQVMGLIQENPYSIVIGATGSGKTTQVPQMILDSATELGNGGNCSIICTQPRRIAATSVARRVAFERGQALGNEVGYHVRNDRKLPDPYGSITYCTTGILLARLKSMTEDTLDQISHIVIDEVHERDITVDLLLTVLKTALDARRSAGKSCPKVVLMSATMDAALFAEYFKVSGPNGEEKPCPSLSVPGRTFPVRTVYLDEVMNELKTSHSQPELRKFLEEPDTKTYLQLESDMAEISRMSVDESSAKVNWRSSDEEDEVSGWHPNDGIIPAGLVAATVSHIARTSTDGAILVFLPGREELVKANKMLIDSPTFRDTTKFRIHMLHSATPAEQQAEVFEPAPDGCRKIIIATNIAETSVTIPDVQYVVDCGKLKERRYDASSRIDALLSTWISKANSRQRSGRAGRVQEGHYYALFTEKRFNELAPAGQPEIFRADLQGVCLMIKAFGFPMSISDFLSRAPQPPLAAAVETAIKDLKSIEALTEDEKLTPLGRLLSGLTLHPSLGKMIIMGIIFRCYDPILILGVLSGSVKPLFSRPPGLRNQYEELHRAWAVKADSDHIGMLNAYCTLRDIYNSMGRDAAFQYAKRNFLSMTSFTQITRQCEEIERELINAGLIASKNSPGGPSEQFGKDDVNVNSTNMNLVRALLVAGLYPNLAARTSRFETKGVESEAYLSHKSFLVTREELPNTLRYHQSVLVYSTLARNDQQLLLRDVTETTPLAAALFGGRLEMQEDEKSIVMDGWLSSYIRGSSYWARFLIRFKEAFDTVMSSTFQDLSRFRATAEGEDDRLSGPYTQGDRSSVNSALRELFADTIVDLLNKKPGSSRFNHSRRIEGKNTKYQSFSERPGRAFNPNIFDYPANEGRNAGSPPLSLNRRRSFARLGPPEKEDYDTEPQYRSSKSKPAFTCN